MRINLAPEFTLDARQRKDVAAEDVGLRSIAINRIWDARNAKYRKPGNMQSGEAPSVAISNPTERKMWVRIDRALKTALAEKTDTAELTVDQVEAVLVVLESWETSGDAALWADELAESIKRDKSEHEAIETAKKNGAKVTEKV